LSTGSVAASATSTSTHLYHLYHLYHFYHLFHLYHLYHLFHLFYLYRLFYLFHLYPLFHFFHHHILRIIDCWNKISSFGKCNQLTYNILIPSGYLDVSKSNVSTGLIAGDVATIILVLVALMGNEHAMPLAAAGMDVQAS
jgi:hypothetical protein